MLADNNSIEDIVLRSRIAFHVCCKPVIRQFILAWHPNLAFRALVPTLPRNVFRTIAFPNDLLEGQPIMPYRMWMLIQRKRHWSRREPVFFTPAAVQLRLDLTSRRSAYHARVMSGCSSSGYAGPEVKRQHLKTQGTSQNYAKPDVPRRDFVCWQIRDPGSEE